MTTDLFLVRHGEVHADWRARIYGCLDVPLSDRGREEARRAASFLADRPLDAVYSSGLSRTRYGAEHICRGRGLEQRVEPELREIDRGDWSGLGFDELERREPGVLAAWRADPWRLRPPAGESMSDLSDRVLPVLEQAAAAHPRGMVAVVAHSHVARCALARALDRDAAMAFDLPTGVVLHLAWHADGGADLLGAEAFGSSEAS